MEINILIIIKTYINNNNSNNKWIKINKINNLF